MKYFVVIFILLSSLCVLAQPKPKPVSTTDTCTLPATYKWDGYHILTPKIIESDNYLYVIQTYKGDSATHYQPCYMTHNERTTLSVWNGTKYTASHYKTKCDAVGDWNKMLRDHGLE
jgi:hypothetical protein